MFFRNLIFLFLLLLPNWIFAQNEHLYQDKKKYTRQEFSADTNVFSKEKLGSTISKDQAELILKYHNQARKEVGVNPLAWDKTLAAQAQKWADFLAKHNNCTMRHSGLWLNDSTKMGENLFWGSDANYFLPISAAEYWYNEKKDYKYSPIALSKIKKTGHYTQMIWHETKYVGVGVAKCPDGGLIVVANYYPRGNFVGEYPY